MTDIRNRIWRGVLGFLASLGALGTGALVLSGGTHGPEGFDTVALFTQAHEYDDLTRGLILRGMITGAQMPCDRVVKAQMVKRGRWIVACSSHTYVVEFDGAGRRRFIERIS